MPSWYPSFFPFIIISLCVQGKPELGADILAKRQTQELQHGRLAMLATAELLRHDWQNSVVPGFDGYDTLITGLPFLY